jgi:hypothetical protein
LTQHSVSANALAISMAARVRFNAVVMFFLSFGTVHHYRVGWQNPSQDRCRPCWKRTSGCGISTGKPDQGFDANGYE